MGEIFYKRSRICFLAFPDQKIFANCDTDIDCLYPKIEATFYFDSLLSQVSKRLKTINT